MRVRSKWRAAVVASFAISVACEDDPLIPPQPLPPGELSDPAGLAAELATVDSLRYSALFADYELANATLLFPGPDGLPRHQSPATTLIPDSARGTTFEWDPDTLRYGYVATARAGAPATGVRAILYERGGTGSPVRPFVELGRVDFLDESTDSLRLRVRVTSNDGATTYFECAATITRQPQGYRASMTGMLSNGISGSSGRALTFNMSVDASDSTVVTNATYALTIPAITLTESRRRTRVSIVQADLAISRPGEIVRIVDSTHYPGIGSPNPSTASVTVTVNGGAFARASGGIFSLNWIKHDNAAPTAAEQGALDRLWVTTSLTLFFFGLTLQAPIEHLLGT